ncbi:MAG: phosphatase PAP2 family protein [Prevotella sp.]|nr:phosphatase PAP2 family protein [Prevotella sp.]
MLKQTIVLFLLTLLPLSAIAQESSTVSSTSEGSTEISEGASDYLRFAPLASVFVLKACGVESSSSWKRLVVNSAASYVISCATTWGLKYTIHEQRPDKTDNHSFPSGHTMAAFAGAHILYKEYAHKSPWIAAAGYGVATFVGIDRVTHDRHHWYDVCAGAAIGILGTEAGYWLGDKITGEHSQYAVAFGPQSVSLAIMF